ncbi:hypothetical protein HK100_007255, partial [Physocladia obscura]
METDGFQVAVNQLVQMGFPANDSRDAIFQSKGDINASVAYLVERQSHQKFERAKPSIAASLPVYTSTNTSVNNNINTNVLARRFSRSHADAIAKPAITMDEKQQFEIGSVETTPQRTRNASATGITAGFKTAALSAASSSSSFSLKKIRADEHQFTLHSPVRQKSSGIPPSGSLSTDGVAAMLSKPPQKSRRVKKYSISEIYPVYGAICAQRDELPVQAIIAQMENQFEQAGSNYLKTLIIPDVVVNSKNIRSLTGLFALNFGLSRLILDDCDIEDTMLGCLMKALSESNTLQWLSIQKNKKIKLDGIIHISNFVTR